MRSSRRVTQRVASALTSVASLLLLATCDFDKISGTPTPLTQQEIDRIFSITPSDTTIILGATKTLSVAPGPGVNLAGTTTRWFSNSNQIVQVDSVTGVAAGLGIGNATVTARILAPELDTGYAKTRQMRVRYRAIKACGVAPVCSPSSLDSIMGLNQSRAFSFFGTDNSNVRQTTALTGVTISTRDSGATTNAVVQALGSNAFARKNGVAYVIGVFEDMRDSIKVKVRQVAKSLIFPPPTDYVATSLNTTRSLPFTMRDVNDSIMLTTSTLRFRSSDTNVVKIVDSLTGTFRVVRADTARITVRADSITRSQKITVKQVVAGLAKSTGTDAQSDTVGRSLASLPEVTVRDSGNAAIAGDTVIFRVATGSRGFISDSVKITGTDGKAKLGSWKLSDTVGVHSVVAQSKTISTTFSATATHEKPHSLRFTAHPTVSEEKKKIAPPLKVSVLDSLGNLAIGSSDTVKLSIGNNPSAATLGGVLAVKAVDGVSTFDSVTVSAPGNAFTITATATGRQPATSNAFDIFGAPTKLAFKVQPPNGTVNSILRPAIEVEVQDATGSRVTSATHSITVAFGANPGNATLAGTKTVTAVNGVARFTDLAVNVVSNAYTLTASTTGLTGATSSAFNIQPIGSPAKLFILVEPPSTVTAGVNFAPAIEVEVQDANGGRVVSANEFVSIRLIKTPPGVTGCCILDGSTSSSTPAGLATFGDLNIDEAGVGYQLEVSAGSLTPDTTAQFTVLPAAASGLRFLQEPTHVNPSVVMNPAVTVAIVDNFGNVVTTTPATNVALTVCCSVTLGGTSTRATASGIATFNDLTISATGTSLSLTASAPSLNQAFSNSFNSVALSGGVKSLRFVSAPSNASANAAIGSVAIELIDGNNARVSTANGQSINVSIESGPGTFVGSTTSATVSNGVASFTNLRIQKAGTYTISASSSGFAKVVSSSFLITPGTATKTGFVESIPQSIAGAKITPAIRLGVLDFWDNVVTSATSTFTLAYFNNPSGAAPLAGTLSKATVDGIATFDDIVIGTAGSSYRLSASNNSGFASVNSNFFNVVAGTPVALGFKVQPANVSAATPFSSAIQVQVQDAGGNAVATATNAISLSLSGGDATAVLSGTKTVNATSGVATFPGLSVDKIGTGYRLNASATGFPTVASDLFNVTIGSASKLRFKTQPPATTTGGTSFNLVVELTDDAGNVVTNSSRTINLSIESGTGTAGATISGTTSAVTSSGVATFNNVAINRVGTGYKIRASESFGSIFATSTAIDVTQGPAAKLTFTVQPTQSNGGSVISPAVQVSVTDLGGNLVSTATHSITLTKSGGESSATLSGTVTKAAVAGVATFNDLSIDKANSCSISVCGSGFGYQLQATASGLAGGTSNAFDVIVGPKARLVFTSVPTSVTSLNNFSTTVAVADAGGNMVSSANDVITISVKTGPAGYTFAGTGSKTLTASSGSASFTSLTLDKAGPYELQAVSGTLTSATSASFTVNAGSASKLVWSTQPANTFVNAPLVPSLTGQQPQITVQDAAGNTVNTSETIRIWIETGAGGVSMLNGTSVCGEFSSNCQFSATAGVMTVPTTVKLNGTGLNFGLKASAPFNGGITAASSASFKVDAFSTKSKLGFTQQPTTGNFYAVSMTPAITVAIQDEWGNTVTTASDQVELELETDANPTTTITGGGLTTAVSGISTFSNVVLNKTGNGYKIRAKSTGLTSASSNAFNVTGPGVVASLSTAAPATQSFAVAGGFLFWADNVSSAGSIRKVSVTSGTPQTAGYTAGAGALIGTIVSDGTNLYWAEDGGAGAVDAIKRMPIAGGTISTIASGLTNLIVGSFALDSANNNVVYVAQQQSGVNYALKRNGKLDNGTVPVDIQVMGSSDPKFAMATASGTTTIYYYDPAAGAMKSVGALATTATTPTTLQTGITNVPRSGLMRVSGTNFYWLDTSSRLLRMALTGGAPTTVYSGSFCSSGELLNDGSTQLYYRDSCNGLTRYVIATNTLTTAVHFNTAITGLTSDGTNLYWYNSSNANFLKAAK